MMFSPALMLGIALFGFLRIFGYVSEPWLGDQVIHQVHGEPARVVPSGPGPEELRVATWNIERGARFDEVLQALLALDADVYLLQEVDMFCGRTGHRNVAKELADALDMNWVSAGEFQEIGEGHLGRGALTGQAVLSRYVIEDIEVIRFDAQARFRWRFNPVQPRRGGRIAVRARTAGILVYNAHMESGRNQGVRHRQLAEILTDVASGRIDLDPAIVAGDFNTAPADFSSMLDLLTTADFADVLTEDDRSRITARRYRPLDWIFAKGVQTEDGQVPDTGRASDHYPVLVTVIPAR